MLDAFKEFAGGRGANPRKSRNTLVNQVLVCVEQRKQAVHLCF